MINETMAKLYRHYMPDRAPIWTQLGIKRWGFQPCVSKFA